VFERIRTLKPSGRQEYEITDVNNSYLAENQLTHEILEGWWTDAGTFESLWRASNLVREKSVVGAEYTHASRGGH
jgi:glucose-1-phosphate thymidylyltransferase